jgi:hypothetical protein
MTLGIATASRLLGANEVVYTVSAQKPSSRPRQRRP